MRRQIPSELQIPNYTAATRSYWRLVWTKATGVLCTANTVQNWSWWSDFVSLLTWLNELIKQLDSIGTCPTSIYISSMNTDAFLFFETKNVISSHVTAMRTIKISTRIAACRVNSLAFCYLDRHHLPSDDNDHMDMLHGHPRIIAVIAQRQDPSYSCNWCWQLVLTKK
jgi:hypothetical protein